MCRADVGDPVAHGFVNGIFQRARPGIDTADVRAEQTHAEHVEFLAAHVFSAHVNYALKAKQRAHGCGRHSMLPGASLRNHAVLAHTLHQQCLPEAVVDFVRAGVQQVFSL